ncbi:hypothetical protein E6C50_10525 [Flavobacterium supellecticarium]|uniref:Uncharacterized protein n=1 Tax=Flavobacterium supellecticarium TaxID=2565924 RepID=A0A4S3ZVE3_9FLAO|nr:hypothetical protein [Flavobacterium supellecticarium]THF49788.1 hypothetical protein E6C50_10525 [Flavobacterium supellecticarium]
MAKNTITLDTAQEWAERWKKKKGDYVGHHKLKAFLIPGIDVTQVMSECGVTNVRAYLGVDEDHVEKLMIVGVDADGNDMIDESKGFYIYDFSEPCPSTCNKKAPFISGE